MSYFFGINKEVLPLKVSSNYCTSYNSLACSLMTIVVYRCFICSSFIKIKEKD